MKKRYQHLFFTLTIPIAVGFTIFSCNKDKGVACAYPETYLWPLYFTYVDSMGNIMFESLDELPFNPNQAFYMNSIGDKNVFANYYAGVHYGGDKNSAVRFQITIHRDALKKEKDQIGSAPYQWLIYIDADRKPDTVVFGDPIVTHQSVDYLMVNSDTVFVWNGERKHMGVVSLVY